MRKALLGIALAAIVMLLLPTMAFAADPAARIGSTDYDTLFDAIIAVQPGETIVLLRDVAEAESFTFGVADDFTIDMNGYDWDLLGEHLIVQGGHLVIDNGGTLVLDFIDVGSGGTLEITAECLWEDYIDVFDSSTFILHGDLVVTDGDGIHARYSSTVEIYGNVTITRGEYTVISAFTGSTVYVSGNVIGEGQEDLGVECSGGAEVTIDGEIDSYWYIYFPGMDDEGVLKEEGDTDPVSIKEGYLQYSHTVTFEGEEVTSYVWVKIQEDVPDEPVVPDEPDEPDEPVVPGPGEPVVPETADASMLTVAADGLLGMVALGALVAARASRKERD